VWFTHRDGPSRHRAVAHYGNKGKTRSTSQAVTNLSLTIAKSVTPQDSQRVQWLFYHHGLASCRDSTLIFQEKLQNTEESVEQTEKASTTVYPFD